MIIGIEEYYLYALILLSVIFFLVGVGVYVQIKKNCPDAMIHWEAIRKGLPVCRVHYKGKVIGEYIAKQEQIEQDLGAPFWTVPTIGIKFKPEPDEIEYIEGGRVRCVNYFENTTEAQKINQVVAYSQLKDYFKNKGMNIEGVEDVAMYVASESQRVTPEQAIINARIDSEETKQYIKKYLKMIEQNKNELESMKLKSGVFTFQTAMKALDSTIAYTSSHLSHTKEVIKAAIMRQEEKDAQKVYFYLVITAFVGVIIGFAMTKV